MHFLSYEKHNKIPNKNTQYNLMNKIIDKKSNVLRICAGNDFSILVQVTEYNTETGAWVNYDLSAVSDVHMCLIADNGKRINLPVTVNSNGTASAPSPASRPPALRSASAAGGRTRRTAAQWRKGSPPSSPHGSSFSFPPLGCGAARTQYMQIPR